MPKLLIEGANGSAELFALKVPRTLIGRAPGNDVVLDDPQASRFHAVVDVEATFFIIKDRSSKNGLYVNGHRILARALRSGDTVTIGLCTARFLAEEDCHEIVVEALPSPAGLRADLVDSASNRLLTP
ncbi:MAG: FHA domain-containing protein [Variovorax sp.]|nr:MAG: FHA domain-containing protein [Variovorax sp.]